MRRRTFFRKSSPIFYHRDTAILRVQQWLLTWAITQPTIPQMAAIGGLAAGTFFRRFRNATGLNPTEYNQRISIEEACELLEFTGHSIDSIAGVVGYEDPAFCGSPSAYRGRFAKPPLDKPRT
jgi:transcriptional regulator GlxA family with amidase domain